MIEWVNSTTANPDWLSNKLTCHTDADTTATERETRNNMSFTRKRSFTFGAYGGWVCTCIYTINIYLIYIYIFNMKKPHAACHVCTTPCNSDSFVHVTRWALLILRTFTLLVDSVDRFSCGDEKRWEIVIIYFIQSFIPWSRETLSCLYCCCCCCCCVR